MRGLWYMSQKYEVKLETFEGPLDLLLHLVNRYEIDIYDIPVATITEQYMNYIHQMKSLELNIASEYLVMASTLLAIKSQMLLPTQEVDEIEDEFEEDPREELVQKLLEYQKYKQAAVELKQKENQTIYTRPLKHNPKVEPKTEPDSLDLYDMLDAVQQMLERKKWNEPLTSTIERTEIPVEERMDQILQQLTDTKTDLLFEDLFEYPNKSHIVVTFVALLELLKNRLIYCKQAKHFGAIYLRKSTE